MRNLILAGSILFASPALAEAWATGDCVTQRGTKIKYMLHDGEGFITYDGDGPYAVYSKKDKNIGIITHIGNKGNMNMAIDLNTGRGYLITKHDNGQTVESNVSCVLSGFNR